MNQRGRLQGLSGGQLRHAGLRQFAQLIIHQRQQSGGRLLISLLGGMKDRHQVRCARIHHGGKNRKTMADLKHHSRLEM